MRGVRGAAALAVAAGLLLATAAGAAERPPVRSLLEMRRDRVVIQQWDLSCGAAALATLLNFQHGESVTEREVALGLIARQDYLDDPALVRARAGFSLLDLKRFVESRGYEGIGYGRLTFDDLLEKAPVLVPVDLLGYNHFVIFRGAMGDRVLLADPAFGNRTLPRDRFMDAWIDYGEMGHVGFVVARRDGLAPPNGLAPRPEDFLALH